MAKFIGRHTIIIDGAPYMSRYWLGRLRLHILYRGDVDPDAHDHPFSFWTFPLTPYVEEVVAPRLARAVRLTTESLGESFNCPPSRATRWRQLVPAFKISHRPAGHAHRILGRANSIATMFKKPGERIPHGMADAKFLADGPIVTIVWRGRKEREWGFLKNDGNLWCWRPWKKYIDGGKHVPCE